MDDCSYTDKQKKGGLPKLNDFEIPPMPTTKEPVCDQCGGCRFWKRNEKPTSRGICRFNPPRAGFIPGRAAGAFTAGPDSTITIWPDTCETDWCGKYQSSVISEQSSEISNVFGFKILSKGVFECLRCGNQIKTKEFPIRCGSCGGSFTNAQIEAIYPPELNHEEREEADEDGWQSSELIRDMLLLVDVDVPVETIMTWTWEQQVLAKNWAALEHAAASDNDDVTVLPRPDFLPPSETEKRLRDAANQLTI